ncbi:MAG: hypothetical protein AB7J40_05050 [Candidatus Altimarinota bacterium]
MLGRANGVPLATFQHRSPLRLPSRHPKTCGYGRLRWFVELMLGLENAMMLSQPSFRINRRFAFLRAIQKPAATEDFAGLLNGC